MFYKSLLLLGAFLLATVTANAQEWSTTFTDPDVPQTSGQHLTVAGDGSWFVSTLSQGHFYMTKYNPGGDMLWTRKMRQAESVLTAAQAGSDILVSYKTGATSYIYAMNGHTSELVAPKYETSSSTILGIHHGSRLTALAAYNGGLYLQWPIGMGNQVEQLASGFRSARMLHHSTGFAVVANDISTTSIWFYKNGVRQWFIVLPTSSTELLCEIKGDRLLVDAGGLKVFSTVDGSHIGTVQPSWPWWGQATMLSSDKVAVTHPGLVAAYSLNGQRLWATPLPSAENVRLVASGSRLLIAAAYYTRSRSTLAYLECDAATGRILHRVALPYHPCGDRKVVDFAVWGNRFGVLYNRTDRPFLTQSVHLLHGQVGGGGFVDEALPVSRDENAELIDQISDPRGNLYSLYLVDGLIKFVHTGPNGSSRIVRSWRQEQDLLGSLTLTQDSLWVVACGSVERFRLNGEPGTKYHANSFRFFKVLAPENDPLHVSPHGIYTPSVDKFYYPQYRLQDAVLGTNGSIVVVGSRDGSFVMLPIKNGQRLRTISIGPDPVEKMIRNSSGIYLLRGRNMGAGMKEYRIERYDFLGNKLGGITFELARAATKIFFEANDTHVFFVSSKSLSTFDFELKQRKHRYWTSVQVEAEDVTLSDGNLWIAMRYAVLRLRAGETQVVQKPIVWTAANGPGFLTPAAGGRVVLTRWNRSTVDIQRFAP